MPGQQMAGKYSGAINAAKSQGVPPKGPQPQPTALNKLAS
jgi:hypothetical protein